VGTSPPLRPSLCVLYTIEAHLRRKFCHRHTPTAYFVSAAVDNACRTGHL